MKRADPRQPGKGALELIEEATHLLRAAPLTTLTAYYTGALPFVLGLLYFWVDMSRSPFANQHLAETSLGLGVLFLWMKFWQAIYARHLRALMTGEAPPPLNIGTCRQIFITQTTLQPWGFFLLPLSLLPVLPFGWAYAFFQNLTALAGAEPDEAGGQLKKAAQQTTLWPRQNFLLLAVFLGFGLYVFINWATICFLLPRLVKSLFGVESIFSRSTLGLLNTTFFACMFGLTYLCVDPIAKAAYALRCFYGESLKSGEDLLAELRQFAAPGRRLAAWLVLLLALGGGMNAFPQSPPDGISPAQLDRTIQQVIEQKKYVWRMPRDTIADSDASHKGVIGRFLERVRQMVRHWVQAVMEWVGKWLRRFFGRGPGSPSGSGYGWIMSLQILLYALVAFGSLALALLLFRVFRRRQQKAPPISTEPIRPAPDLTDENLGADQLPEDGWMRLGRELLGRGELRLALRAFYLASLAHLAGRNLISIAKFKSNRDYERELRRRGHSFPELIALFGDNVAVFDRVWYGLHQIDDAQVSQFAANIAKFK
jgi:hypothetical protein